MLSNIYSIDGVIPVVHPESFVHPAAIIIGDVIIEQGCYVGPGACLRGDFSRITLGVNSNVQENCVVHSFPGDDVIIEDHVIIAHGAILHGCHIARHSLIGMNAVVMDGVKIGEYCLVAAMSFVPAGKKIESSKLVAGSPAKVMRDITKLEKTWQQQGLDTYKHLTQRCLTTMQATTALTQVDKNRPRLNVGSIQSEPLHQVKDS